MVWVTQLRPRVTAYPDTLLMQGSIRDTHVPYVLIDEVAMAQTLNVWVGRKRYVCVGIGKSIGYDMRQRVRSQGGNTLFGSRAYQFTGQAEVGGTERKSSYQVYVLDRITDLVAASKARGLEDAAPRGAPAVRRPGDRRAGGQRCGVRAQPAAVTSARSRAVRSSSTR